VGWNTYGYDIEEQIEFVRKNTTTSKNPTEADQMTALQQNVEDIQFIGNTSPFVRILIQGMNNEHLPGHQLIPFVEETLDRSKKHLFLRDVLKESGWT
jgi:hypothetical protein